uniref:Uncharacterized protein n=1 Tax=Arundo donax TaxID=35708 RepID=A0A0A8ZMP5_ARUDO
MVILNRIYFFLS